MTEPIVLIYATAPSVDVAEQIVGALLDQRLIACANVWPGMRAHYIWAGTRQADDEVVMILKTRAALADAAIAAGRALHPYATPAFVVVPVSGGLPDFLSWTAASTATA